MKISLKELLWKSGFRYLFAGLIVFFIATFSFVSFETRGIFNEMSSHLYTAIELDKALINEKKNNLNNSSWHTQEKILEPLNQYHDQLINEDHHEDELVKSNKEIQEILKTHSTTNKLTSIAVLNTSGYAVVSTGHKQHWIKEANITSDSLTQVTFVPIIIPISSGLVHIVKLHTEGNYYLAIFKKIDTSIFTQLTNLEATRDKASLLIYGFFLLIAGTVLMLAILFALYSRYIVKMLYKKVLQSLQTLLHMANQVSNMEYIDKVPQVAIKEFQNLINILFHTMTYMRQANDSLQITNTELQLQSALTQAIVENISSGIILLSSNKDILVLNKQVRNLLNLDETKADQEYNISEILPHIDSALEQSIQHSQDFEQDISKDLKRLMIRCTHLQDKLLLTIDDITYQVSAQKQAAWRDVARVIAHEIKNPLTPTRLCAEQLLDALKNNISIPIEKQLQYLNTIVKNVEHVNKLINNFTAFAKQSQQTLQLQEFELKELLNEVIDTATLGHSDIEFILKCKANLMLKADRQQIFQATLNLVQNAIQAFESNAQNKQIQISGSVAKNQCTIKITDNGSGIPIENIEKLFQPYMTTKSYGTGLGLVIVRKIAQAHDGNVTLTNNPDQSGATAIFSIPANN